MDIWVKLYIAILASIIILVFVSVDAMQEKLIEWSEYEQACLIRGGEIHRLSNLEPLCAPALKREE